MKRSMSSLTSARTRSSRGMICRWARCGSITRRYLACSGGSIWSGMSGRSCPMSIAVEVRAEDLRVLERELHVLVPAEHVRARHVHQRRHRRLARGAPGRRAPGRPRPRRRRGWRTGSRASSTKRAGFGSSRSSSGDGVQREQVGGVAPADALDLVGRQVGQRGGGPWPTCRARSSRRAGSRTRSRCGRRRSRRRSTSDDVRSITPNQKLRSQHLVRVELAGRASRPARGRVVHHVVDAVAQHRHPVDARLGEADAQAREAHGHARPQPVGARRRGR